MKYNYIYLHIAKMLAKVLYASLKLNKTQNKVVLISRFHSATSIDFMLLIKEIKLVSPKTKIVVLNHKLKSKSHLIIDVLKEMYHLSNSRCAIIDSYIIPVSILKHKKKLKIIQIWHSVGVSKKFGYTTLDFKEGAPKKLAEIMEMHKNYDYIIASGKSSVKLYPKSFNVSKKKILNLGIPRVDYLVSEEYKSIARDSMLSKYPILSRKKNILYAPTFRKGKKIPYLDIINEVDFDNYNLIIKRHHLDKTVLNDPRVIDLTNENIFDVLFVADYLITDYSALMFEAAIALVPMFFYTYDVEIYEKRRGLNIDLIKDLPGFMSDDPKKIIKAIEKEKFNLSKIKSFRDLHVDNLDGNSTKRIVKLLELGGNKNEK